MALLLGATDRAIGLVGRFARCFRDGRRPERIEHTVETLVGQRVFGLALGYEDLVGHDPAATRTLFVDLFLDAHPRSPGQIILDLDATGPRNFGRFSAVIRALENFGYFVWPKIGPNKCP